MRKPLAVSEASCSNGIIAVREPRCCEWKLKR